MKKITTCAMCAFVGAMALAAEYHVYGITLNAKTTGAKGIVTNGCGDDYCYRDKQAVTIRGILGGCGCGSILANGTCDNAILYLWDATHKLPITNVETSTGWQVQRIGKKQTVLEHFVRLQATYGDSDEYYLDVTLAGFGEYAISKSGDALCRAKSISGNFAGVASAPIYYKAGQCSACRITPDTTMPTTATSLCATCEDADGGDYTPFFGAYTIKYAERKSKAASKSGLTAENLELPSYVGIDDYVATNIED